MSDRLRQILSRECGPFWQFAKYGAIGLMATLVQTAIFYILASTCLKCLKPDDLAVRLLGLPAVDSVDAARGLRFVLATAIGFLVANIFCWLMNRAFVFQSGKFVWYKEFALFISVSGFAMMQATLLSWLFIHHFSLMTTLAVLIEVVVSFLFNYFLRKFFIFKG